MRRNYDPIIAQVGRALAASADLTRRLSVVVDGLWDHLHTQGVSWAGFYLKAADGDELVLGPRRDKPACSPIGMHGACGRAFLSRKPLIVRDVSELGENYIACDPRDKSEVVIPFSDGGAAAPVGVLDLDSFEIGAFDEPDVAGLRRVLTAANLRVS